ncbi:MAG: GIY-YIG nuclease family protein [Pseudomonadota bacterium]
MRRFFVYILVSRSGYALYTGTTSDLRRRLDQHLLGNTGAHTHKYRHKKLVWFELHETLEQAHLRAKQIKRWRRAWKLDLVSKTNPNWRDLATDLPC